MNAPVRGVRVDRESRCAHWHGPLDVVAISFPCCGEFYACADCHAEVAGHPALRWGADEHETRAVRCGACAGDLSIAAYLATDACPRCGAGFNPRCSLHRDRYFD